MQSAELPAHNSDASYTGYYRPGLRIRFCL